MKLHILLSKLSHDLGYDNEILFGGIKKITKV